MATDWRAQVLAWAWVYGAMPIGWLCVLMHALTPWRKTELGRHLMVYSLLIAIILTFASIRHFTEGQLPAAVEWFRFVIYLSFPFVMGWRLSLQIRAARRRS